MKMMMLLLFISFASFATTPKEAWEQVNQSKAIMLDVREQDELKTGMIDKAQWFPMSKITANAEWEKDFRAMTGSKKIFLYCRSGNRSGKVEKILTAKGIPSENIGGFETLKLELPVKIP